MSAITDYIQLPISGAIIEILEYFLALSHEVQFGVKSHPRRYIGVLVYTSQQDVDYGDHTILYTFKVIPRNLQSWFDADEFISSKVPDVLKVIPPETHRKGDPGSTQGFFITCPHKDNAAGQPEQHCVTIDQCGRVCMHKSSVPTTSASEEVSVVLQVLQAKNHIADEINIIYQYLYKLKILNLQLGVELKVHINEDECRWDFGENLHGYRYHAGDVKIATDIGHYLSQTSNPSHTHKIKPSTGSRHVIPSPTLWDDTELPLKLSVITSIVPSPSCQAEFRNTQCGELSISLFGPGNIPLHIAGKTQFPVDPVQLIRWQDYGLTLGDVLPSANSQGLYEADKRYQLIAVQEGDDEDTSYSNKYVIQLFIVLTRNDKTKPLVFHERQDLLQVLRNNMTEYFAHNQAKLNSATVTAINKVLKCHSAGTKSTTVRTREESVGQAINSINQAISTVVSHSVHDEFRHKCFNLLKVTNSVELSKVVTSRLWSIAKCRFGVTPPEELQESCRSQESMSQSQQDSQTHTQSSLLRSPGGQSNAYSKEDSVRYNWSQVHPSQPGNFDDDADDDAAAAELANLDVFPESDEQWLESLQMGPERSDDDKKSETEDLSESFQSEKILKTTMGEDWFEEVLLNCDWMNNEC